MLNPIVDKSSRTLFLKSSKHDKFLSFIDYKWNKYEWEKSENKEGITLVNKS